MIFQILAETAADQPKPTWFQQYGIFIIMAVFLILMTVMMIVPQRKRQKEMQNMLNNLSVGDKIMTIGRMIGTITYIDSTANQITMNVGTEEEPTLVVMDRNAVGIIIESKNAPKPVENTTENTNDLSLEKKDDSKTENKNSKWNPFKKK